MAKSPEFSPSEEEISQEKLETFDIQLNKEQLNELIAALNEKRGSLEKNASEVRQSERRELLSQRASVVGSIIEKFSSQETEK